MEYRAGEGPWTPYQVPFKVRGKGRVEIAARAASVAGQYVYRPSGKGARGAPVAGLLSPAETVTVEFGERAPAPDRAGGWFGRVFGRRSRDEKKKK